MDTNSDRIKLLYGKDAYIGEFNILCKRDNKDTCIICNNGAEAIINWHRIVGREGNIVRLQHTRNTDRLVLLNLNTSDFITINSDSKLEGFYKSENYIATVGMGGLRIYNRELNMVCEYRTKIFYNRIKLKELNNSLIINVVNEYRNKTYRYSDGIITDID